MGEGACDCDETYPQSQESTANFETTASVVPTAEPVSWGRLIPLPPTHATVVSLHQLEVTLGRQETDAVRFSDSRIR